MKKIWFLVCVIPWMAWGVERAEPRFVTKTNVLGEVTLIFSNTTDQIIMIPGETYATEQGQGTPIIAVQTGPSTNQYGLWTNCGSKRTTIVVPPGSIQYVPRSSGFDRVGIPYWYGTEKDGEVGGRFKRILWIDAPKPPKVIEYPIIGKPSK
jgi:hypothetical protein